VRRGRHNGDRRSNDVVVDVGFDRCRGAAGKGRRQTLHTTPPPEKVADCVSTGPKTLHATGWPRLLARCAPGLGADYLPTRRGRRRPGKAPVAVATRAATPSAAPPTPPLPKERRQRRTDGGDPPGRDRATSRTANTDSLDLGGYEALPDAHFRRRPGMRLPAEAHERNSPRRKPRGCASPATTTSQVRAPAGRSGAFHDRAGGPVPGGTAA
jgi:hypothetical protein